MLVGRREEEEEEEEESAAQYLYFLVSLSACAPQSQCVPVCPSVPQCAISWEQCSHVGFLLSPGEQHN